MSYRKSQLNAISRWYTERDQQNAKDWLIKNYGVTYEEYAAAYAYKGSPVTLMHHLKDKSCRTTIRMIRLWMQKQEVDE